LSLMAVVVLFPLCAVAAAAIRLTSPGPVIFCQERVGLNRRFVIRRRRGSRIELGERRNGDRRAQSDFGRPFIIYKFRTMVRDAEKAGAVWTEENDPRITPVGRILRKLRIDEIPQFLNVLLGDMSVVGPRPERSVFIAKVKDKLPEFASRLSVKPGISGLAQVELGYTNTVAQLTDKLKFDLMYINNLTPWTDLKILVKTLAVVLTAKGT
jgi:lipopolysaccharide/colanic/teichoic acid biosynthesis glycosyltransferase